ncbi:hypothetical protein [Paracoccus aminophilus]|uniref:DUF4333 domain-containing protein n=1 Tax=Paracoccus aminophilus JCM 7686 TaxID=1367847 RepID=S5Y1P2_PARAH|nr:hypothetical protein [Paracoccus aminophilus]AGT09630.1 hypothetical protein JCM7686_2562 [Paracoccus aminophilus JCM 7686]
MRGVVKLLVVIVLIGLGFVYFSLGPSFLLGGPKNADIVAQARLALIVGAPTPAEADLARRADLSPQGLCNRSGDGSFACLVDVSVEGTLARTFVAVLRKDANGNWTATP